MAQATYTNNTGIPIALAVFLATDHYDHDADPFAISATTLLKPLRQIILPARIPVKTRVFPDIVDQMSNRLGSAIHDGIETAWRQNYRGAMAALGYPQKVIDLVRIDPTDEELQNNPDIIPFYMEQRAKRKIGKWTVTGKWDFIGEGKVQDYKTASVWSYKNQVNADKQIKQGSIYRWLDSKKITQATMEIHHIFMDWKAALVGTEPNYPPQRSHKQSFPLMSLEETENFIRQKIMAIEKYWNAPEADIPECDEEELWRSKPVYKYYKNGDIYAAKSTKNFGSAAEAYAHMSTAQMGAVKEVLGQVKACRYCPGFEACTQKDRLIAAGELVLINN